MRAAVETYVQCGIIATRDHKGNFLPAEPLYMKAEGAARINERSGLTYGEEVAAMDFATIAKEKFGQYVRGINQLKREAKKKEGVSP